MGNWEKFMEFCNTPIWQQETIKFDTKEELIAFLETTHRLKQAKQVREDPRKDVDMVEWKII